MFNRYICKVLLSGRCGQLDLICTVYCSVLDIVKRILYTICSVVVLLCSLSVSTLRLVLQQLQDVDCGCACMCVGGGKGPKVRHTRSWTSRQACNPPPLSVFKNKLRKRHVGYLFSNSPRPTAPANECGYFQRTNHSRVNQRRWLTRKAVEWILNRKHLDESFTLPDLILAIIFTARQTALPGFLSLTLCVELSLEQFTISGSSFFFSLSFARLFISSQL